MDGDNHGGNYAGRRDEKGGPGRKDTSLMMIIIVMVAAVFTLLVVVFLISPLKEMIFPSKTAPAVALVVAESGPSAERAGFYRILVEALVEGTPEPRVEFNRNDGLSEQMDNQTLLLLADGETFLLKAQATNPLGTAEAELELFAGIMGGTASGRAGPAGPGDSGAPAPGNGEDEDEDEPDGGDPNGAALPDGDEEQDDEDGEANGVPTGLSITRITTGADELLNPDEFYTMRYEENSHYFHVSMIYDGDAVAMEVESTHGSIEEVRRGMTDVSTPANSWPFYFIWRSPANPAGNREALNVQITVTATGASGASDGKVINIALLPAMDDVSEIRVMRLPVAELSGLVNEEGLVVMATSYAPSAFYVGDSASDMKARGFVSFDLSELAGRDIIDARLSIQGHHYNDPSSIPGNFVVSSTRYGGSLDSTDYLSAANPLYSFPTDLHTMSFSNDRLIAYLQSVADVNRQYAQFILEYETVSRNGIADRLFMRTADIVLEVGYN